MRHAWYRFVGWVGTRRLIGRLHPWAYRHTGGRGFIGHPLGNLTVILVTVGAKSGQRRETPIWAYPDGDALVLVSTNGGREALPGWVTNLRAHPDAEVLVGREQRPVRGREATGDEYERLWALVTQAYPGYLDYRARITRPIPLVVLERRDPTT